MATLSIASRVLPIIWWSRGCCARHTPDTTFLDDASFSPRYLVVQCGTMLIIIRNVYYQQFFKYIDDFFGTVEA